LAVGVGLFFSYAYFYQAGGWNQNSRFALVRAVLERHTLQIDAYQAHTGDRSLWQGHYYSDKAPGTSLLAIPVVAVARGVSRLAGVDPESFPGIAWTSYAATVATSGAFTVLAAFAVFWVSIAWGASEGAALFAMTAYGLAGPAWCYATLYMGHGVTAGCLITAFAAAVALERDGRHRRRLGWIVGLAGGLAVLSEVQAAPPVLLIAALAVVVVWRADPPDARPVVTGVLVGGAIMALVLVAYYWSAFGWPIHLGYTSEDSPEAIGMREGVFGVTRPTAHVAYEVLLGSYRGLLPLSPLVALAPIGLLLLARQPSRRLSVLVAAASAGFYIFLNLSYHYWEGGWAYAPRQLTPSLPFLALGLAPLWDRWRGVGRILLAACWLWGATLTLIAVSTTPQPPSNVTSPVTELLWPAFREGDLSLNNQTFVDHSADPNRLRHNPQAHASWNLGEVMKLHGLASLLPLGAMWGAVALSVL
jgi:hypothetical protein